MEVNILGPGDAPYLQPGGNAATLRIAAENANLGYSSNKSESFKWAAGGVIAAAGGYYGHKALYLLSAVLFYVAWQKWNAADTYRQLRDTDTMQALNLELKL
jgi:hypothetical protein